MTRALLMLLPLTAIFALPAHADPIQPQEPQYQLCTGIAVKDWGDPAEIETMIADMGYEPINVRIEKGCWEVKALDKQQEVFEFYVHPLTKEVVLRKHKPQEEPPQ